jgi:hypothetical protein
LRTDTRSLSDNTHVVCAVTVNDYSGDGELSEATPVDDSEVSDDWSDAGSSEFASADDSDTGLDGDDDFGDDSSWT